MSAFIKNFIRCISESSVRRPISTTRKKLNPELVRYFENMGVPPLEIESLFRPSIKLSDASPENVNRVLKLLESYNVDNQTVLQQYPKILGRNCTAMEEYARVLQECGCQHIKPEYLISYFRITKKIKIKDLKNCSIIPDDLDVYDQLCRCLKSWGSDNFTSAMDMSSVDAKTLFDVRMEVLQKYLKWRLNMEEERFSKVIKTYNRFYHRTLQDMERSIDIAETELHMSKERIIQNPFVISADPNNTMKIIEEVGDFHGIDARKALHDYTLLLKENYMHLIEINKVLKEHNFPQCDFRVLKMYVYKPDQLDKRLSKIESTPDITVYSTSPSLPFLVEYSKFIWPRLDDMKKRNVKCRSYQILTCSKKVYENKMLDFADKYSAADVVNAIYRTLKIDPSVCSEQTLKQILSRHIHYKNVPLTRVADNIIKLSKTFSQDDLLTNCHLLLYSEEAINEFLSMLLKLREKSADKSRKENVSYLKARVGSKNSFVQDGGCSQNGSVENGSVENASCDSDKDVASLFLHEDDSVAEELKNLDLSKLSNSQILSATMYLIERKFTFSDSGVWEYELNEH